MPKLYTDLASWWPLLSAPEDYEEEAAFYGQALVDGCSGPLRTLLELGSGGGGKAVEAVRDQIHLGAVAEGKLDCEPMRAGMGVGIIEGWRGPVLVALRIAADGLIQRCHPHDPSWQNWPVLEHAIIGNIVPDFPLINKSFNLSYSGHDL